MPLPDVATVVKRVAVIVPLSEPDPTSNTDDEAKHLVFLLRPVASRDWDNTIIAARDPETGTVAWDDIAPQLLALGVESCGVVEHIEAKLAKQSAEAGGLDSLLTEFTADDAAEVWSGDWPGFVGSKLIEAVRRFYETGTLASPKVPRSST